MVVVNMTTIAMIMVVVTTMRFKEGMMKNNMNEGAGNKALSNSNLGRKSYSTVSAAMVTAVPKTRASKPANAATFPNKG